MNINIDYVKLMIYNEPYGREVRKMQTKNEADNKNQIDLNEIVFLFWEKAAADQDTPYFDFVKIHDQILMAKIKKYSNDIRKMNLEGMVPEKMESVIESVSTDLYDSITQANLDYLRHGIKIGARLLAELVI